MTKSIERVVVASSDKAYGAQPTLPYTEDMPLLGANPYDASKVCTDVLAHAYQKTYGMPVAIARCANVYGGGDLNFSRLIPGTIRSALMGESPIIRSDGTPIRDYLFIADAVSAYLTLGERIPEASVQGHAFNFGMDQPISATALVDRILEICGTTQLRPRVLGSGSLVGEIHEQYLDSRRARAQLGWIPTVTLDEGLHRAVRWYAQLLELRKSIKSRTAEVGASW